VKQYQIKNNDKIREYYQKHRVKILQNYQDNKQKFRQYFKEYKTKNKDKLRGYDKKYRDNHKCPHEKQKRQCKECNFKLYLIMLQRSQLRRCFKNSNLKKTKPSIEYLGCSAEYFMEYFKKKMDKFNLFSEIEMTWSNIHIDHIKPISVFDLNNQDEFIDCSNYTNLQPLIAEMNLKKSNRWNDVSNDFWLTSIINNEHADIYVP